MLVSFRDSSILLVLWILDGIFLAYGCWFFYFILHYKMAHANLCWERQHEMFICHWLWKLRYEIWACDRWILDSLKGSHKVSEHFCGELYSFVDINWWLFDQLRFPLAESSYLLMITTESHLGVLIRTSTLLKGATVNFAGIVLNMLVILSPIKLKN